jgi:hypothetical protein
MPAFGGCVEVVDSDEHRDIGHCRNWPEAVIAVLSPQVRYEEVNSSVAIRGPSRPRKRRA